MGKIYNSLWGKKGLCRRKMRLLGFVIGKMLPLSSFLKKICENIALKLLWVSTVSEFEAALQIIMNKIQETNKD